MRKKNYTSAYTRIRFIRKSLHPVFKKYSIIKAILFGSFAKDDTSTHSDIDLVLITNTTKRFFKRYDGILEELNAAIEKISVEPLIYTPDEFEKMKNNPFISKINNEGILLYESK